MTVNAFIELSRLSATLGLVLVMIEMTAWLLTERRITTTYNASNNQNTASKECCRRSIRHGLLFDSQHRPHAAMATTSTSHAFSSATPSKSASSSPIPATTIRVRSVACTLRIRFTQLSLTVACEVVV